MHDRERVRALHALALLDTPPEREFDEIVALLALICRTPIALVSLVDETRVWFKAKIGVELAAVPREGAFCDLAIREPEKIFQVEDATRDARFAALPWVTGAPQLRFYAGVSLVTKSGYAIGTLCVLDRVPRTLDEQQERALVTLGRQIMAIVELREELRAREQLQMAIRNEEQRYRQLFEQHPAPMWVYALETLRFLAVNDAAVAKYGYTREEFLQMSLSDIRPSEDVPRLLQNVAQTQTILDKSAGWRHRLKDGTLILVEIQSHALDFNGQAARLVQAIDITNRVRAEEKLHEQARLLDEAKDAILVRDLTHRITYWNKGAERLYGWTSAEVVGRAVDELLYRDAPFFQEATATTIREGEWAGEIEQVTKQGKRLVVASRWALVRGPEGQPKAVLAISSDITEQRKLEQQSNRSQRLESLGTMAGGIAHDLNNILAPIAVGIGLLRHEESPTKAQEVLDLMEASANRGRDLVKQVLLFARGVEGQRMRLDPGSLVQEVYRVVRQTFPKSLVVETEVAPDLWSVEGDATQINQVLLNLCVNARDAMPNGGRLFVGACNRQVDQQYSTYLKNLPPGRYVQIKVTDTGTGIPREILDRIFEPFFTTKEEGKGTGLGLATVLAIMKSHGGMVDVYSEVGRGSTFNLYLPATSKARPELASGEGSPSPTYPRGRGECILVVDDEEPVRDIVERTLRTFGYRPLLAQDGASGLAAFAAQGGAVDLVLTDMSMPVLDGPDFVAELRKLSPQVPIIVASGLDKDGKLEQLTRAGLRHFLVKPFSAGDLLVLVDQALREARADASP